MSPAYSLAVMAPSVRIARPGDGAGIARVWLDASAYYAELDPGHFKVPDAHGLLELTDGQLGMPDERAVSLVAEVDDRLVGWLSARLELPHQHAARQFVREHDWTRLLVDALIVERQQWRRGAVLRTAHGISAPLDRLSEAAMTFYSVDSRTGECDHLNWPRLACFRREFWVLTRIS